MTITPQELQWVKDRLSPIRQNKVLIEFFLLKDGSTRRFVQGIQDRIYRNERYRALICAMEWDLGISTTDLKIKIPRLGLSSYNRVIFSNLLDIRKVLIILLFKDSISTSVERKFGVNRITEDSFGVTLELQTFNSTLGSCVEFSSLGTKIK